ncbi:hypothetical protein PGB34_20380 [Xenophilus arseniciresistens]|uniref:Uncharacterized protein n=1 Tax=Xenophilus arseniciresistens TaxID=1283306 RepID=A0AAE3NEC8_9BURK|nr:hypothetical protein [Xenophilus arseniciresistens]MDA7418737.1 hypothetical protein [Xenophilus arseniciresistens]
MDFAASLFSQWPPHLDEWLIWGVAGAAACIAVVALVNALEIFFDSEMS